MVRSIGGGRGGASLSHRIGIIFPAHPCRGGRRASCMASPIFVDGVGAASYTLILCIYMGMSAGGMYIILYIGRDAGGRVSRWDERERERERERDSPHPCATGLGGLP